MQQEIASLLKLPIEEVENHHDLEELVSDALHECYENSIGWVGKEVLSFDICITAEENNRIYNLSKIYEQLIRVRKEEKLENRE